MYDLLVLRCSNIFCALRHSWRARCRNIFAQRGGGHGVTQSGEGSGGGLVRSGDTPHDPRGMALRDRGLPPPDGMEGEAG